MHPSSQQPTTLARLIVLDALAVVLDVLVVVLDILNALVVVLDVLNAFDHGYDE